MSNLIKVEISFKVTTFQGNTFHKIETMIDSETKRKIQSDVGSKELQQQGFGKQFFPKADTVYATAVREVK